MDLLRRIDVYFIAKILEPIFLPEISYFMFIFNYLVKIFGSFRKIVIDHIVDEKFLGNFVKIIY